MKNAKIIVNTRLEIKELMHQLNCNTLMLRTEPSYRHPELLLARTEIYKSIAHRQGRIIEAYERLVEYLDDKEVAA